MISERDEAENWPSEEDSESGKLRENEKLPIKLMKTIAIIVLGVIVLIMTIVVIILATSSEKENVIERHTEKLIQNVTTMIEGDICTSEECAEAATFLIHRIKKDAKPCDDFYEHACGRFEETTYEQFPGTGTMELLASISQNVLKQMMKNKESLNKPEESLKLLYGMCLKPRNFSNIVKIELLEVIDKVGPWPMVDSNWNEADFDLTSFLISMVEAGNRDFGIFQIEFHPSLDGEDLALIEVKAGRRNNVVTRITELLDNFADNNNITKATMEEDIEILKKFENKTNEFITKNGKNSQNKEINIIMDAKYSNDLDAIQKFVSSVDWERLLDTFVPEDYRGKFNWTGRINVDEWIYFTELADLLNVTDSRTLANYLIFKFIDSILYTTDLEKGKLLDLESRERDCMILINRVLPLNFGMTFVHRYVEYENINGVIKMADELTNEFIELVKESSWLDEESKNEAVRKIETMTKNIGYPKQFHDKTIFVKRYEKLQISENDSLLETMSKVKKWRLESDRIDMVENNAVLFKDVHVTNAFYRRVENSLNVGASLIRMPFYDKDVPEYYNLAISGHVVAHEMGHGFDNKGVGWRAESVQKTMYSNKSMEIFNKSVGCFEESYSAFKHPGFEGLAVNGSVSISENLADYIGMKIVYRLAKKLKDQKKLPGFHEFDHMKMFFYSYASLYCHNSHNEDTFQFANKEVHGFSRFRVNGVLSNFEGFSKTFGCEKGSMMNPEKKCKVF